MKKKSKIDGIIARLKKSISTEYFQSSVTSEDLIWLCMSVTKIVREEPILLRLQPPISICGDIHGQYIDLQRLFQLGGPVPKTNYLFLGDYVGRGPNSIETIAYLFALKIKYPNNIWILRGNHETDEISRTDGFFSEFCFRKMEDTWYSFTETFRWLPISAVVGRRIFCVHGGISPLLTNISQIEALKRPLDLPESGLVTDLLWSDPAEEGDGWQENDRGTSVTYGPDVVDKFLSAHKFDLLCRAHQMATDGFSFPFGECQNCVTLFTAPNYCEQFNNAGALMRVEADLTCTFEYLEPTEYFEDAEE